MSQIRREREREDESKKSESRKSDASEGESRQFDLSDIKPSAFAIDRAEESAAITDQDAKLAALRLDLNKISKLSGRLFGVSKQLRALAQIVQDNPDDAEEYHDLILQKITEGRKAYADLLKKLQEQQIFRHMRTYCNRHDVSVDDLPENELEMLSKLGVSAEELARQFQLALDGLNDFGQVFLAAQEQLEYIGESVSDKRWTGRALFRVAVGATNVLGGLSLLGLNIAAFAATWGLIVSLHGAIASGVAGTVMTANGASKLSETDK